MSQTPQIASGVEAVDQAVNPVLQQNFAPVPENSVNPLQVVTAFASAAWIAGILFMIGYMIVSSLWLRKEIRRSGTPVHRVFESSDFEAPFVFGMFRPVICLPPCDEAKKNMILLHERTHIARRDHILKPAAFIILSVYWFNPLVWLAYHLLCRDIEMACDEAVIQKMARNERSDYAQILLEYASAGHIAAAPVAFGETDVKRRIRNILKYRKPSAGLAVCFLLCAAVICTGCFADQAIHISGNETVHPNPRQETDIGKKEETAPASEPSGQETGTVQPQSNVVTTVELLLQNPSAYIDTYVYVRGNLPQSIAGMDENGNPIAYLNGSEDLSQKIRIINYIPSDGSVPVEAYGTVVLLDNGEPALSMDGYTVLEQQPSAAALTVEAVLQNPSVYIDTYVYVRGTLPQGIAGMDENGNPIAYLNGFEDRSQRIRIINYIPSEGSIPVEAYGTLVWLDSGEPALSMDGYRAL
jgi:beta-lactamase regulating signal transducer with metallopeptidase domain